MDQNPPDNVAILTGMLYFLGKVEHIDVFWVFFSDKIILFDRDDVVFRQLNREPFLSGRFRNGSNSVWRAGVFFVWPGCPGQTLNSADTTGYTGNPGRVRVPKEIGAYRSN